MDSTTRETTPRTAAPGNRRLQERAARVTTWGWRIAVAIMAVGLALSLVRQQALPDSLGTPNDVVRGVFDGDASSVVGLGVLAIILTPIVCVATILATFLQIADRRYALVTSVVLAILLGTIGLSLN